MGPKSKVVCISAIFFISFLIIMPAQEVKGQDHKDVFEYLHGDPGNATINTSLDSESKEYHILTTGPQDTVLATISIGEWVTEPIVHSMTIQETVWFLLFAKGNLQQVRFTGFLTVNGVEVSNAMTTEAQDLNEDTETIYISTPVNITTPLELNNTDIIGFRLTLQHNDPQWYTPPPLGSGGKNVSLLMGGFNTPSQISFKTNSMQVSKIIGEDDPSSGNIIVTAEIKCAFGVEDFNYATAKSDYGSLRFISEEILDESTVEVKWDWDYTVSEGGSYPVKVTARDKSYNSWQSTEDIHITTPYTEVDFVAGKSTISFENDPEVDKNTTIKAKITGAGKRWNSYTVEIEFYDDNELIEVTEATINRAKTNVIEVVWIPESGGTHSISVIVDPDDEISETNENNNAAQKSIEVGGSSDSTPGFEAPILIAAFFVLVVLNFFRFRKR
jgi:hypothetical protein